MATTIGIDLGTTNTAAALAGQVLELGGEGKSKGVLASVVAYPPTGAVLVGSAARRRRAIDPANTIFSAKRIIGRTWHAEETRVFAGRYPFALSQGEGDVPVFHTRAGPRSAVDIGAAVLGVVRAHAPGDAPVVVTVPSSFAPAQRDATVAAARQAGFASVSILDEPVAAAWAYLGGDGRLVGRRAAVYDLGGGTFDLAILDTSRHPFTVLAHGGELYLGGDDIDYALASWAAGEVLAQHRWDLAADRLVFDRLVVECERAKVRLSFAARTQIELAQVDPAAPFSGEIAIDRVLLERLCADLVRRTFTICDEVLARAGLRSSDIDAVYLAGGTTLLPTIASGVASYFGRAPRCDFDPMEVVAIGASRAR